MATARVANDAYYTDPPLALEICKRLHPLLVDGPQMSILEPSAGAGAFCKAARRVWGPESIITAVEPYLPSARGDTVSLPRLMQNTMKRWQINRLISQTIEAWLSTRAGPGYDLTIGNPPYKLAEEHLALVRPISKYVVFLLRLSFLGSQGRATRIFNQPGLRYLMPIAERPHFIEGKGGDNSEYAVFVWQRGFPGLAQILPPLWVTKS